MAALYIEIERQQIWRDQNLDSEIAESLAGFSLTPIMRDNLARGQYNEVFVRTQDDIVETAFPLVLNYIDELRRLVGVSGSG